MKIAFGCDHGGYELKQELMKWAQEQGHEVKDVGCYNMDSCDYPDFGEAVARAVASGECERGVVMCTTGIGISISANKVAGIRCALCGDLWSAEMTRRHNNANVLCLGGRVLTEEQAVSLAKLFVSTPFEGGRHQRRIDMMEG